MTDLAPNSDPHLPKPAKLAWLTFPLLIGLIFWGLSLLTVPFSGSSLNETLAGYDKVTGMHLPPLSDSQIQTVLWLSFFITAAIILWLYNTRRAVLEGKRSGRTSSIVIAVLSLLFFPFGTVLGIIMLIGAFDREVVAYLHK